MMLPDFRVRQRDYLLELTRALTQELDLDKLLERVLTISVEMLAGQAGLIVSRKEEGGWRVAAANGIHPAFLHYLKPLLAQIAENEDPENYEIPEISRLLKNVTYTASLGLLTGVGLRLIARHEVFGVIFIFRSYSGGFSINDRALLSSFADQAAIALRNAQLYTQVRRENERLDALLDSAADGILILSADHHVERFNLAFAMLWNGSDADIQNKLHEEIIQWAGKPQGLTLTEAEAGGWPLTPHAHLYVEGDLKRNHTSPLPVGITYAPLLSNEGTLLNVIATVRDLTRFRQADELKSTFISIISHELKTPVALIKGYVSTLRRDDAEWDRSIIADSLEVIEEEADRLAELIENMLDASRLQAGAFALRRADVNLKDLTQHLAERLQTQTSVHKIRVELPDDLPIILADEDRLRQVLSNLISNSIKYAPEGEIVVRGQVRQDQIMICVSDEGPGIQLSDIPHIFDRFYRSPEASRNSKGAGLGLYLAKAVIEAHGGRIWVDPKSSKGARICFSLPLS
jgi:signal transduction histidine kinase